MADAKPNYPAVFIEKIFPVMLLNQQLYYEHGSNSFKVLHRWYSRKPLSFSRVSVLGALLPDTLTPEDLNTCWGYSGGWGGSPIPPSPTKRRPRRST